MNYFVKVNPNPKKHRVGDCVVRAISIALNQSWETTFIELCFEGFLHGDMPSSNALWSLYLKEKGFKRTVIPDECENYTVEDFCKDHPKGTYVLGTGSHAICVKEGKYHDAWDSGNEAPIYYFMKDEE